MSHIQAKVSIGPIDSNHSPISHQVIDQQTLHSEYTSKNEKKNINETPFGVNKEMILLQVVLVLSPIPSTTTPPAILEADNMALSTMHIIM